MIRLLAEGGVATPPPAQNNFGDTLSDGVAGPTALLIIVLLAIATVLLIRNMNKRLRRLPAQFPIAAGASPAGPSTAPTDAGQVPAPQEAGRAARTSDAGGRPRAGAGTGGVAGATVDLPSDESRS
jgi:hypothetical protein